MFDNGAQVGRINASVGSVRIPQVQGHRYADEVCRVRIKYVRHGKAVMVSVKRRSRFDFRPEGVVVEFRDCDGRFLDALPLRQSRVNHLEWWTELPLEEYGQVSAVMVNLSA